MSSFRLGVSLVLSCALVVVPIVAAFGDDAGETPRVSEVCLDCHDGYDAGLAWTPHRLTQDALDGPGARVVCTDCHAGGSGHWEDDPEEYKMMNLEDASAADAARACSSCHMNSHQQNMLEKNVHLANEINCSACHRVHDSKNNSLLRKKEPALCLECHTSVEGQFALPYRHPVNDEIVRCSECHLTLDKTSTELSHNGSSVCYECHAQYEGPFPYEHQATLDYSAEEGGCLSCHNAHGSYLPRLLKQPYEPPHYQLCTQCHSVPLHNMNSFHGTEWAGIPCGDCHNDIHGSYTNRNFLNESLEGAGCFNSGCHQF